MSEWFVTHDKCGESDGPFATYEEAKAHYEYLCNEGDPDSAHWYFIEEVNDLTYCEKPHYDEDEVDAEYICAQCGSHICFDHMKPWPQPKWEKTEAPRYCTACFSSKWATLGDLGPSLLKEASLTEGEE